MGRIHPLAELAMALAPIVAGCEAPEQSGSSEASPLPPEAANDGRWKRPAAESGITARARLADVLAQGRRWQPDAELHGVSTAFAEGPASEFWLYDLQSRSSGTCTRLRAMADGRIAVSEPSQPCRIRKPVADDFVDSTAAIASAVEAGMKQGESTEFSLRSLKDQALASPRACWVVSSDFDAAEGVTRGWCVDPATGGFVVRLSGYGGPVFE